MFTLLFYFIILAEIMCTKADLNGYYWQTHFTHLFFYKLLRKVSRHNIISSISHFPIFSTEIKCQYSKVTLTVFGLIFAQNLHISYHKHVCLLWQWKNVFSSKKRKCIFSLNCRCNIRLIWNMTIKHNYIPKHSKICHVSWM